MEDKPNRSTLKDFMGFGEVAGYFFRKKDQSRPRNFSLRMMHGVNKLSILMFLAGMTYLIVKSLTT